MVTALNAHKHHKHTLGEHTEIKIIASDSIILDVPAQRNRIKARTLLAKNYEFLRCHGQHMAGSYNQICRKFACICSLVVWLAPAKINTYSLSPLFAVVVAVVVMVLWLHWRLFYHFPPTINGLLYHPRSSVGKDNHERKMSVRRSSSYKHFISVLVVHSVAISYCRFFLYLTHARKLTMKIISSLCVI